MLSSSQSGKSCLAPIYFDICTNMYLFVKKLLTNRIPFTIMKLDIL